MNKYTIFCLTIHSSFMVRYLYIAISRNKHKINIIPFPIILRCITYLELGQPVPLGTSGDEKSPSLTVTGDPAGSMPANTHLFQIFFGGASPCLLLPPPVSSVASCTQYIAEWMGLSLCSLRTWPAIFLLLVVTMSWSRSMPALPITSSCVAWSRHEMPRM